MFFCPSVNISVFGLSLRNNFIKWVRCPSICPSVRLYVRSYVLQASIRMSHFVAQDWIASRPSLTTWSRISKTARFVIMKCSQRQECIDINLMVQFNKYWINDDEAMLDRQAETEADFLPVSSYEVSNVYQFNIVSFELTSGSHYRNSKNLIHYYLTDFRVVSSYV